MSDLIISEKMMDALVEVGYLGKKTCGYIRGAFINGTSVFSIVELGGEIYEGIIIIVPISNVVMVKFND